jgi:hypothetical protein
LCASTHGAIKTEMEVQETETKHTCWRGGSKRGRRAHGCLLPLGVVELEAARSAGLKACLLAHVLHHDGNNRNEAHNSNWREERETVSARTLTSLRTRTYSHTHTHTHTHTLSLSLLPEMPAMRPALGPEPAALEASEPGSEPVSEMLAPSATLFLRTQRHLGHSLAQYHETVSVSPHSHSSEVQRGAPEVLA